MFCVATAGGVGGRVRPDALPGRVYPGGAGHEDQPDRGQGAGKAAAASCVPSTFDHVRKGKLSHSVISAMHFNNINIMVNIRLA